MCVNRLLVVGLLLAACEGSYIHVDSRRADVTADARAETDGFTKFAVVTGVVAASGVAAPDYALDIGPLFVEIDNDGLVVSATGTVDLVAGRVSGQVYAVTSLALDASYAEVDRAFGLGPRIAIDGRAFQVDAAAFSLVGMSLGTPQRRHVIVANTVSGVSSYQVHTIFFASP